jgi:hypothetical protein
LRSLVLDADLLARNGPADVWRDVCSEGFERPSAWSEAACPEALDIQERASCYIKPRPHEISVVLLLLMK